MKKSVFLFGCLLFSLSQNAQTQLWGVTQLGGQFDNGVIFKTDGSGNNYTLKYSFDKVEGENPYYTNLLQASDGNFYGMAVYSGTNNNGILFQYNPVTNAYTKQTYLRHVCYRSLESRKSNCNETLDVGRLRRSRESTLLQTKHRYVVWRCKGKCAKDFWVFEIADAVFLCRGF